MAQSLKLTIELAGAEEIKRQLEGVGQAGEAAFDKILNKAKEVGGFNKLDPGVVTKSIEELGVKGPAAIDKITQAVESAGRMETLINALTGVENGLAGIQTAASAMDAVLLKGLTRSIGLVARLLPAAFGAATVGAIATTTKSILELDAAAIKLGVSIEDLSKAQKIFKQLGLNGKEALQSIAESAEKMNLKRLTELWEKGGATETIKAFQEAIKGSGKDADFAREKLKQMGLVDVSPTAKAIEEIKKSAQSLPDKYIAIIGLLEKMGNTAERNQIIFDTFGQVAGTKLIQKLNAGIPVSQQLVAELAKITPETKAAADAANRLAQEWEELKKATGLDFKVSPESLQTIADILAYITNTAIPALNKAWVWMFGQGDLLSNTNRELIAIGSAITTMIDLFRGFSWNDFTAGAIEAWKTIIGWVNRAIQKAKEFFSIRGRGGEPIPDAGGFARGGLMGGRGSGTSDSNLAWLSRGEHIMPAYAVRQPGVLQLLEALRRSGGNLRGVLDRMGHFALGGMVGMPAYAAGGGAGGMSHVTIQFPGLAPITGLRASSVVVDELRRSAALAQVRSGGRKPSRYT